MNVKGRDLLSIDEPSSSLSETDHDMYEKMGLKEVPFRNVKYFDPYGERGTVKSYIRRENLEKQIKKILKS